LFPVLSEASPAELGGGCPGAWGQCTPTTPTMLQVRRRPPRSEKLRTKLECPLKSPQKRCGFLLKAVLASGGSRARGPQFHPGSSPMRSFCQHAGRTMRPLMEQSRNVASIQRDGNEGYVTHQDLRTVQVGSAPTCSSLARRAAHKEVRAWPVVEVDKMPVTFASKVLDNGIRYVTFRSSASIFLPN
jgi:hypothetical protein